MPPAASSFRALGLTAVFLAALALFGCGKPPINYQDAAIDVIYDDALSDLHDKQYKSAAQKFAEVERQHPYSVWARRAILMSAYSYYMANQYSDSILASER